MTKDEVIANINAYAPVAIYYGFDYPRDDDPNKYTVEELTEFLEELRVFIKENI